MIQRFADRLVYGVFGMSAETHFGSAVNFFFYDSVKILILLFLISMVMGIVNAYFPIDNLRHYLATRKLYGFQYLFASLFGAITPFCSCSSIPLFIGFVKGGIPLGVTFAFLITSPLVNEVAVAMFLGSFGMRATAIYVVSGILLGMIGGFVLGRFKLERYLSPWVRQLQAQSDTKSEVWTEERTPFVRRLPVIVRDAWGIVRGVLVYVLIGIGAGAAMHGYVPEGFFRAIYVERQLVCRATGCRLRRTDVCQRRRNRSSGAGLRDQRHSAGDGYRLYDGRCRVVVAGSHDVEKGDDMAADRDILRSDDFILYSVGICV